MRDGIISGSLGGASGVRSTSTFREQCETPRSCRSCSKCRESSPRNRRVGVDSVGNRQTSLAREVSGIPREGTPPVDNPVWSRSFVGIDWGNVLPGHANNRGKEHDLNSVAVICTCLRFVPPAVRLAFGWPLSLQMGLMSPTVPLPS